MPIKESAPTKPSTAYALGKILSEAVLDFFSSVDGAQVTTLRIANPIGRWQFGGRHGFVAAAVLAAVTGQELTIFGDGNNSRDYFDADDFAEFLLQLCLAPTKKAGVFNIGSGVARTELQVIEEVERMAQKTLRYNLLAKRPFDLRYAVLDCGSAEANLNWNPKTEFDASVAKMIDALRLASGN
jgi:UDP-glucose 4-epimerase